VNKGENSEYFLKAFLLKQKDRELEETIFRKIEQLSDAENLEELKWEEEYESNLEQWKIEELKKVLDLKKSKSNSKADISINNITYSVKEVSGGKVTIVNQTKRPGFEFVCEQCDSSIKTLDKIIELYWKNRCAGILGEDVRTNQENSPFEKHKEFFRPIINYFLFTGTGSKLSNFPAMKILEINDYKILPKGIKIIEKEDYFDQIWDNLVFSVRSYGMPANYPKEKDQENHESVKKWTEKIGGKYRGCFNVRVGKNTKNRKKKISSKRCE
jgi:hypothetical protein